MTASAPVGTVRFDLSSAGTGAALSRGVPIDIRRSNLTLVATVLSTSAAELEPGRYYVSARLPAGRVARAEVDVAAGRTLTVTLTPDDDDDAPGLAASTPAHVDRPAVDTAAPAAPRRAAMATALAAAAPAGAAHAGARVAMPAAAQHVAAIRLLAGNVLAGECVPVDASTWAPSPTPSGAELTVPGLDRPCLIQIWQRGQLTINMMVPTSSGQPCRLSLAPESDGRYAARAMLPNDAADLLVRYAYRTDVKRSSAVAPMLAAEQLLAGKLRDPISATVGAYALLKLGDLDRLHEWTETLRSGFRWLPDGLVVRGEHLARLGRHAEACDTFAELPSRGMPISTEGLSWSIGRLRSYARAAPTVLSDAQRARAASVLAVLQPFGLIADFRCPFTAYPGTDPRVPSVEPASDALPADARAIG